MNALSSTILKRPGLWTAQGLGFCELIYIFIYKICHLSLRKVLQENWVAENGIWCRNVNNAFVEFLCEMKTVICTCATSGSYTNIPSGNLLSFSNLSNYKNHDSKIDFKPWFLIHTYLHLHVPTYKILICQAKNPIIFWYST